MACALRVASPPAFAVVWAAWTGVALGRNGSWRVAGFADLPHWACPESSSCAAGARASAHFTTRPPPASPRPLKPARPTTLTASPKPFALKHHPHLSLRRPRSLPDTRGRPDRRPELLPPSTHIPFASCITSGPQGHDAFHCIPPLPPRPPSRPSAASVSKSRQSWTSLTESSSACYCPYQQPDLTRAPTPARRLVRPVAASRACHCTHYCTPTLPIHSTTNNNRSEGCHPHGPDCLCSSKYLSLLDVDEEHLTEATPTTHIHHTMFSSRIMSALAAVTLFSAAAAQQKEQEEYEVITHVPTPTVTLAAREQTPMGCYETGVPLQNYGDHNYQSPGNCQLICIQFDKPVMALTDGENCWCGDLLPPKESQVDDDECKTPCSGTEKSITCGGPSKWEVILTGASLNEIEHAEPAVSSSSSSSISTPTSTSTRAPIATATETAPPEESSGPNKAGIAAGVVVGVLALCGIVAGVLLFLRRKKRRELEEEHRRQAAVSSFVNGGKLHTSNSSMTDSRLDPEFMARRASNGSIADNEDYSRRILKVTNA
ncbi:hypothetical protein M011DRAFT_454715 [Sporormia fimetaria CBS 119925]|uniref:WSC domain-containing protein n=1 Tax=Sporormia fimetaria CBS 119925 TaxID=1340428 RepID=A0A6A6VPW5_9PLEO|nr:hypothetical protein M011DRAFT_454715 [Sporormia fimetaria CBS 119925]